MADGFVASLVWALLSAVTVVSGVSAAPASAATPPLVTITSPLSSDTVLGDVTMTVSVEQDDASHPVTQVFLQVYGEDQGYQHQTINVLAGQCAPICQFSAVFHTADLVVPTNPDPSQAIADLSDGTAEFAATVYTSFGPTGFTSVHAELENHRPTLDLPDLPLSALTQARPVWEGTATLTTDVQATPNPESGQPITTMRLMVPNSPVIPLADVSVAAASSGTGAVTLETSKVTPGYYVGYLAAVDAGGTASELIKLGIRIDDSYGIATTVLSGSPDQVTLAVTPTWVDGTSGA